MDTEQSRGEPKNKKRAASRYLFVHGGTGFGIVGATGSIDFYGVSGLLHAVSDAGYRAEIGRSFDAESESGGSEAML
jgi:hypothetical protein